MALLALILILSFTVIHWSWHSAPHQAQRKAPGAHDGSGGAAWSYTNWGDSSTTDQAHHGGSWSSDVYSGCDGGGGFDGGGGSCGGGGGGGDGGGH